MRIGKDLKRMIKLGYFHKCILYENIISLFHSFLENIRELFYLR